MKGFYEMNTEQITLEEAKCILENANIPLIPDNTNYWFVRTSSGNNFESFYFGHYIAIGWDKLNNLTTIKESEHDLLKKKIEDLYPQDTKPGSTASQIIRFVNLMKPGDYVLIPGSNCDIIAFGRITSDAYIYEPSDEEKFSASLDGYELNFLKRRNVEWLTEAPYKRSEIDPMLIPIIYSYGTIVDANPYSLFINRSLYSLYYQRGKLHSVFDIAKRDNISAYELNSFINNIFSAMDNYSEESGFEIDKRELSIKASINSPGPIEIITAASAAFIFLAALSLFLNGAKVNFSYNIFNLTSGEIKINSPGLLDKIQKLSTSNSDQEIKRLQIENKLNKSKQELEIKKKKKKK